MFDVPFQYGQGWDAAADEGPQPVVVLSHETNEKVFGGENSVGRTLKLGKVEYRVVGVLQPWAPSPKFFDLNNGSFEDAEDAYVPFGWGKALRIAGVRQYQLLEARSRRDATRTSSTRNASGCSSGPSCRPLADRDKYQAFVDNYARSQKAAGRMPRPLNNRLYDVEQWLDRNEVVQRDNRVLIGIALLFLGVCLVNVVGLLLAKFLNAAPLTGLRRALGASRRDIVRQHLTEVLLLGLAGGRARPAARDRRPGRHPRDLRLGFQPQLVRAPDGHRPGRRARHARRCRCSPAPSRACIRRGASAAPRRPST